ncbi:HTH-type transcriptional regulator BhcR [Aestuariicoccus sp. MJ-SS9]|uniref:HTH-type transcriptional regulator BhcR n=1 Tax=Aestuariicoccus sp. MJ-SS9 TaxID=3079855 RepID=UPI0029068F58|nr:HTH-type transcriptional regulator BhcR [Aestuariicoccus sp. MJ-SS9]MDU8910292.1 IclR family transcriptional regulator [Aestuariicoccus sp. MJ-SS9]
MAEQPQESPPGRRARGRPRAWGDTSDQNTIKSLDRAMQVLERLSELGGATLSDLAADLGQPPASVYRVLYTLEARGIVDFDATAQTWDIGAGAFRIGSQFLRRTSLVERARPVLRHLMGQTGETANLGVARDGKVLFISQVETHASIRAFFPPGTMSPMHASGIGKALLAQMTEPEVAAVAGRHGLERFTEHTLTDRDRLFADLAAARARGYAIDYEEKNLGMRCIAASVFDMHGEAVAGLSISGPAARIPDAAIPAFGAKVAAAAESLTIAIGGTPPAFTDPEISRGV